MTDQTTAPRIGWTVCYWQGDRERTGRVVYVDQDTFDVRWSYGGHIGTDAVAIRNKDWRRYE